MYFNNLKAKDPADIPGSDAIIDSIKKRWVKADQDIFIAAVLLNPFIKNMPFSSQVRLLTRAGILGLMKHLYKCFFAHTESSPPSAPSSPFPPREQLGVLW
jgi:hypothetical protein